MWRYLPTATSLPSLWTWSSITYHPYFNSQFTSSTLAFGPRRSSTEDVTERGLWPFSQVLYLLQLTALPWTTEASTRERWHFGALTNRKATSSSRDPSLTSLYYKVALSLHGDKWTTIIRLWWLSQWLITHEHHLAVTICLHVAPSTDGHTALVPINEGLYFRSPTLATRFVSNAASIAKVLVKALLNLILSRPTAFGDFRKKTPKRTWLCAGISPIRYALQTR